MTFLLKKLAQLIEVSCWGVVGSGHPRDVQWDLDQASQSMWLTGLLQEVI